MYVKSALNFVENFKFILLSDLTKMKVYYEHQVKYDDLDYSGVSNKRACSLN